MILYELRKRTGKTQAQVANDLGIGISTYGHYEKGRNEPDLATLIKLADYFHTTIDTMLGREINYTIDKSLLSNQQCEIIELSKQLDINELEMIISVMQTSINKKVKESSNNENKNKRS